MKFSLTLVLFLTFLTISRAQEYDLLKIADRSEKYYSTKKAGMLSIRTTFKSSIAESFQKEEVEITFCKELKKYTITAGGYSSYLTRKKYYYFDIQGERYMNLSTNKSLKEERKLYLEQFPQFDENYFARFRNNKFRVEVKDSFIHVFDVQEHFYLDKLNYAILRYENFNFSATGLQIKKWEIVHQQDLVDCKMLSEDKLLAGHKKVKTFESIQSKQKIVGEKFSDLTGSGIIRIDEEITFVADSANNRFILLDFFYQSCMPCIQSFAEIKLLYAGVREGSLKIIGVDPVLADSATMNKFKDRYKLKHAILSGTEAARLNQIFNSSSIFPFYVLMNSQGIVVKTIEGYDPALANTVNSLMK